MIGALHRFQISNFITKFTWFSDEAEFIKTFATLIIGLVPKILRLDIKKASADTINAASEITLDT
jgi:hypothetical protein